MAESLNFDAPLTIPGQLDARVAHPAIADRVFIMHDERSWTYRQYRAESIRMAHFLHQRLGRSDENRPGHVAMFSQNHMEIVSLFGGCAYGALTLFGINTGLRGDVLAGVLNQSRARVLVVDELLLPEIDRVRQQLKNIAGENLLVICSTPGSVPRSMDLLACLEGDVGTADEARPAPAVDVQPEQDQMVIYTSGTTGLPKGIRNNHLKLCFIGLGVATNLGLTYEDVGYACMPFFHSNSIFLGLMPALWCGGSLAVRERFSASRFVPDVFRYGVTYWNYVGEPVHYILAAIDKQFGGDEARIATEITFHPDNRLRYALGNGASPPDIDRFMRWLGLDDVFELYGSTEAAISIFRRKGDPRGSVGEITDPAVKILNDRSEECPPAQLGPGGQVLNYESCVGEICRLADTGLFQGYFDNPAANEEKYRGGIYHSGDLGHVCIHEGKRFLFFDGRTDDWIRKDGENFSAAQVSRVLAEHPDIAIAVAYGVPCPISDEFVMVVVKLRAGAVLDPQNFYDWCAGQVASGSMDEKWFPDFVRVVDDFEYTPTQKVLVRLLKRAHFDRRALPNERIYWRRRGDSSFYPFTAEDYVALRKAFAASERLELLDR